MLKKCVSIFKDLRNSEIQTSLMRDGLKSFSFSTKKPSDHFGEDSKTMGIRNVDQLRTEVDSDILDAENESFGRFKGFVGEHKYYFLQITLVLLLVNYATRTIINSKDNIANHSLYVSANEK